MAMKSFYVLLLLLIARLGPAQQPFAPTGSEQIKGGRFTFVAMPGDVGLARNLLASVMANDSFPGLPRPTRAVTVVVAPDEARFREWIGAGVPEWGVAVAFLDEQRVVMQGHTADSRAGSPQTTLRHELAHLALQEQAGSGFPHWFHEGYASYAAGEWSRDEILLSSFALALRGVPHLATLDSMIEGGSTRAEQGYALAHRAVADMAARDPARGLSLFFVHWKESRKLDAAVRTAYGITLSGFEDEWRRTTRRRYGAIALFADLGFATLVLFVIVAPFWMSRRRRDKRRLAALVAADELADRRERESALAALLGEGVISGEQTGPNDDQIKER
jgi:hypothetical protein